MRWKKMCANPLGRKIYVISNTEDAFLTRTRCGFGFAIPANFTLDAGESINEKFSCRFCGKGGIIEDDDEDI